jgi:hypothetical protein
MFHVSANLPAAALLDKDRIEIGPSTKVGMVATAAGLQRKQFNKLPGVRAGDTPPP